MTSKSLSSENKNQKSSALGALILQNLRSHMALLLLGLVVMLFNYPVNLGMRLTEARQEYMVNGYLPEAEAAEMTAVSAETVIGGADGPTSIFVAEKAVKTLPEAMREITNGVLLGPNTLIPLIVGVAAILCAFSMFRYLYSKRQTDFYQALPVSRGKRFWGNYLSGLLIMALCYGAGLLGALLVSAAFGVSHLMWAEIAASNAGYLLMFLLIYTAAGTGILLCGNLAVGVLAVGWLFSAGPVLYTLISALKTVSFDTIYDTMGMEQKLLYLSPVKYLTEYTYLPQALAERAGYSFRELSQFQDVLLPHVTRTLLGTAAITVILLALNCWLFAKRPSESAGNALAFSRIGGPVRFITTVAAALYLALFGFSMESLPWVILLLLIGALIMHGVMESIFHLDIKAILRHKGELIACIAVSLLGACLFWFDLLGTNSFLPERQEVSSVSVYAPGYVQDSTDAVLQAENYYGKAGTPEFDPEGYYDAHYYLTNSLNKRMELSSPEAVEAALQLGENGILHNNQHRRGPQYSYEGQDYVRVIYRLSGGEENDRNFYVDAALLQELMPELFAAPGYKEAVYPVLDLSKEEAGAFGLAAAKDMNETDEEALRKLSPMSALSYQYYGGSERQVYDLTGQDAGQSEKLLSALQADLRAMDYETFAAYCEALESPMFSGEKNPYSYLIYVPLEEVLAKDGLELMDYTYTDSYPILECFTHVREVLEESYGITLS